MNKDKKVLYTISLIVFAVLAILLFIPAKDSKLITAITLIPLALITRLFIKKRVALSINKREVLLLLGVLGAIYVILIHMSGLYFGFYINPYFVSLSLILTHVLPLVAIIVCTEIIRSTLLAQKNSIASISAFISCVLAEALACSTIASITSFNRFMDFVGMTLFPAISANVLYHYLSKRYGAIPNIVFRIITTLYVYFIPTVTSISDALLVAINLIFPLIVFALSAALFEKKKKNAKKKHKKLSIVGTVLASSFMISIVMLISCQFRFGAIIIATESMTGEINKGDMIIYERYEDQQIKEGQVIVFLQHENKIIHRVVKIERIGNETRYYTKGDANDTLDIGYRTDADIVGLTDMKIAYVGLPTLWLRDLLEGNN